MDALLRDLSMLSTLSALTLAILGTRLIYAGFALHIKVLTVGALVSLSLLWIRPVHRKMLKALNVLMLRSMGSLILFRQHP